MSPGIHLISRMMLAACIWLSAGLALACGGFFAPEPMDQTSQRIIFAVNGDGTMTTIQGIGYEGEASDFVWMLPLPSLPTVEVAEVTTLDALDSATAPYLIAPRNPCAGLTWTEYGTEGVGAGRGAPLDEGSVGPYDYVVLDEDSADAIVDWLQSNGYNVPDAILPALEKYVESDMLFLAMKLRTTASTGDIQPVKITYKGDKPAIPIQFAATSVSQPSMPFRVWILGESRYMAENYANPNVDFWNFRAVGNSIQYSYPFSGGSSEYFAARQAIQQQYGGKAFVTEFAMPADFISTEDAGLMEMLNQYPYVTRMEALMSADQMTEDVSFVPMASAPDVSREVDLSNYVDPLTYWGCSTRALVSENTDPLLETFSTVNNASIGHPANWIHSEFLLNVFTTVHVFAPEAVTIETLRAFMKGETTPPMFVVFGTAGDAYGPALLLGMLGFEPYSLPPDTHVWRNIFRYQLFTAVESGFQMHFELLTSAADYEANRDLYDAMLDYAGSHPNFAHPELRHTLFLAGGSGDYDPDALYVGFPVGWQERSTDEDTAVILPENVSEDLAFDAPFIYVHRIPAGETPLTEKIQNVLETYGITGAELSPICPRTMMHFAFEHDGRKGYLQIGHRYYVEASAPVGAFTEYETVLKQSGESFKEVFDLCG